jgi:hypothetical protein
MTSRVKISPERTLPRRAVASFVLSAPRGSVIALGEIEGESLRDLLDQVEPERDAPRALFARITPRPTAEAIVEQVNDLLARTAHRLWPIWFTDVSFTGCRNDTLGRLAAAAIARRTAAHIIGLSPSWAEEAAKLTLDNLPPRVKATLPAIELTQLALAISRYGLVFVVDLGDVGIIPNPAVVVHALEWIAQQSQGAVVALFPELPANKPPFDRILYDARRVLAEAGVGAAIIDHDVTASAVHEPWIAPWLGLPHPLSEIEQRLAKALGADAELAPLFGFNQFVDTVRGSRPKVDLVWTEGRLVVEIDGYGSHGNRAAFMYDRHRDYELILSGYSVLRLANDEIAQDVEKAVEKIRDIVQLCRARMP